jgi:hypothetical protein
MQKYKNMEFKMYRSYSLDDLLGDLKPSALPKWDPVSDKESGQ